MKTPFLYFLIFSSLLTHAQEGRKITYELTRKLNGLKFNADGILKIMPKQQTSEFLLSQYKNLLKGDEKILDDSGEETIPLKTTNICSENKTYYFDNKAGNLALLLYDVNCKTKTLIEEKIILPKWKLLNDYKTILGHKCQKATAFINDRIWNVYFTTNLNITGGPWKLIGLPGLVLEASESTSSIYQFRVTKIEKIVESDLKLPKFNKKSSFQEFVNIAVRQQTDKMIFQLSQIEGIMTEDLDPKGFPLYETLDFIEKRKLK